jgi:hypothetical protein
MVERKIVRMNSDDMFSFRCVPAGVDAFTCQCMPGYIGLNCETTSTGK